MNSDEDIARAQALGRAAARCKGGGMKLCPYPGDQDDDTRVLRLRWTRAYVHAGGRVGLDTPLQKVADWLGRALYGPVK